jgi:hypothetical protein
MVPRFYAGLICARVKLLLCFCTVRRNKRHTRATRAGGAHAYLRPSTRWTLVTWSVGCQVAAAGANPQFVGSVTDLLALHGSWDQSIDVTMPGRRGVTVPLTSQCVWPVSLYEVLACVHDAAEASSRLALWMEVPEKLRSGNSIDSCEPVLTVAHGCGGSSGSVELGC